MDRSRSAPEIIKVYEKEVQESTIDQTTKTVLMNLHPYEKTALTNFIVDKFPGRLDINGGASLVVEPKSPSPILKMLKKAFNYGDPLMKADLTYISDDDLEKIFHALLVKIDCVNSVKSSKLSKKEKIDMIYVHRIEKKRKREKSSPLTLFGPSTLEDAEDAKINIELSKVFDEKKMSDDDREYYYRLPIATKKNYLAAHTKAKKTKAYHIPSIRSFIRRSIPPVVTTVKEKPTEICKSSSCKVSDMRIQEFQFLYARWKISQQLQPRFDYTPQDASSPLPEITK